MFSPGESHGQRRLAGYSPQVCTESDMTEATEHACMLLGKFSETFNDLVFKKKIMFTSVILFPGVGG